MSKHEQSEQKSKSGHTMATQNKSKDSEQYWMQRVFLHSRSNSTGITYTDPEYSVRISHDGRRKRFQLGTANKKTAAQKARDIYRNLVANGWEKTTEKKSVVKAGTATTIGDIIRVYLEHSPAAEKTAAEYVRCLRNATASMLGIEGDKSRFDYVNGGADKWHAKIESVKFSRITFSKVSKWKTGIVKERATPDKKRSARTSFNTYLTGCRSIFGAKVIKQLREELPDLPDKIPFDEIPKYDRQNTRYKRKFDVLDLIQKAREELPGIEQDQQWIIFMLAVSTGLRRNEIDKLTWSQIDFDKNNISLEVTEDADLKNESSDNEVQLDPELSDLLKEIHEKHGGKFVLQSKVKPLLQSKVPQYRANRHHQALVKWLRKNGVTANKPIHTLRKEVGSIINEKEGLYAASKFLRHSDIQVTAAHYVDKKAVSSGLGSIIAGKEAKQ